MRTTNTKKQNAQAPDILLRHRRILPQGPHRLVLSPRAPSRLHSDGQPTNYGHVLSRIVQDSPARSQPRVGIMRSELLRLVALQEGQSVLAVLG